MDFTPFLRRWLPKQVAAITTPPKSFRSKLLPDDGSAAVELELGAVHPPAPAYELREISRSCSATNTVSSGHDAGRILQAWQADTSSRASSEGPNGCHPMGNGLSSNPAGVQEAAAADSLQRWQQSPADVRLVVGVLLERAGNCRECRQHLKQLLASCSWSEGCQHFKDGLLIWTLLRHYFPDASEAKQLASASSSNGNSSNAHQQCTEADSSSSSSLSPRTPAWPLLTNDLFITSQHQQQDSSSEAQQLPASSTAQLYMTAVHAAGVQLPHGFSASSTTEPEPQQLLQLLAALIVAGELQQLLQDSLCGQVLQAQQQQQQGQHAAVAAAWQLLQAWLCVVAGLRQCMSGVSLGSSAAQHGSSSSSMRLRHDSDLVIKQQQQHDPDGRAAAATAGVAAAPQVCSWREAISALLWLQQQQQQQNSEQGHADPRELGDGNIEKGSDGSDGGITHSHGRINASSSSSSSSSSQLLQQLQQLGCSMPLLQPADVEGSSLPAAAAGPGEAAVMDLPGPLQVVLLLRLVGSTTQLWLPALQQQQQSEQQQQAAPTGGTAVPLLLGWQRQHHSGSADETAVRLQRTASSTVVSPRSSWPPELLTTSQLWPGDDGELDAAAITREERTLRCWINSLLHRSRAGANVAAAASAAARGLWSNGPANGSDGGAAWGKNDAAGWEDLAVLSITATAGPPVLRSISCDAAPAAAAALGAAEGGSVQDSKHNGKAHWVGSPVGNSSSRTGGSDGGQQQQQQVQAGPLLSGPVRTSSGPAATTAGPLNAPAAAAAAPAAAAAAPAAATAPAAPAAPAAAAAGPCQFSFPSIASLFGPELRSGVLLLELLELLHPGCVDWRLANRLPFKMAGAGVQLLALENCQMALQIAKEELGLPLVSMSPHDIVLGRRKAILSLVYQLMRYHTMQLLESITTDNQQQQQGSSSIKAQHAELADGAGAAARTAAATAAAGSSPSVTPSAAAAAAGGRVNFFSSSKKQQRRLAITEADILHWANTKLQQVQPLSAAATTPAAAGAVDRMPVSANGNADGTINTSSSSSDLGGACKDSEEQQEAPVSSEAHQHQEEEEEEQVVVHEVVVRPKISSFKDPVLHSGVVLLQLLHVLDPGAVDLAFVTPGLTPVQRESNAKYALSVADKMGCSLFLVWEDLVDLQPRMVLVLLASLMYLDQTRSRGQQQQQDQGQGQGQVEDRERQWQEGLLETV